MWPVSYACAQPYHPGSGSQWQWQSWTAVSPLLGLISMAYPEGVENNSFANFLWEKVVFGVLLKGLCHGDIAVFGQFCAEATTLPIHKKLL